MTNINEIYDSFLSKITDYTILKMVDEEIRDLLFRYFDEARGVFYKCKSNLDTVEINGETFIVSDITQFEKRIIVSLMLVEHITPQLISCEKMRQTLNDKDFKIYSQANQLREVRLLLERMERRANKMMTQYTYLSISEMDRQW